MIIIILFLLLFSLTIESTILFNIANLDTAIPSSETNLTLKF